MSNGTDEIKDLRQRLENTERAIGALHARDLAIVKAMAAELCEMHYKTFTLFLKGDEIARYTELWSKRLADTKRTIQGSEIIEDVIKTHDKFVKDITDYAKGESIRGITEHAKVESIKDVTEHVKRERVDNADQAMGIAHSYFKKKGKTVALPMKAVRQDDIWLVDIDVGTVRLEIAAVKVDAKTGEVLSYEIIQKK